VINPKNKRSRGHGISQVIVGANLLMPLRVFDPEKSRYRQWEYPEELK
jgi:hypothetical protein